MKYTDLMKLPATILACDEGLFLQKIVLLLDEVRFGNLPRRMPRLLLETPSCLNQSKFVLRGWLRRVITECDQIPLDIVEALCAKCVLIREQRRRWISVRKRKK